MGSRKHSWSQNLWSLAQKSKNGATYCFSEGLKDSPFTMALEVKFLFMGNIKKYSSSSYGENLWGKFMGENLRKKLSGNSRSEQFW